MVMSFVPVRFGSWGSKDNYGFSYDYTSLKFCGRFRYIPALFIEKLIIKMFSDLCETGVVVRQTHLHVHTKQIVKSIVWLVTEK